MLSGVGGQDDRRAARSRRLAVVALALVAAAAAGCRPSPEAEAPPDPQALGRLWDAEHLPLPAPPLLVHAELEPRLQALAARAPGLFALETIGRSVEGRALYHVSFGSGPFGVLLWSQMHGDEPTATSALLDLVEFVRRHRTEPVVSRLLAKLRVHVVPMLNPDGAEAFERRNAQGLDLNRDALLLQSPEGRALKRLRDRLEPTLGFNLHDQNWQTSVGRPPRPAAISLLSVAYDEARSVNSGRVLTKKLAAVVRDALEPLAPGRIGRYDDAFEVRAFGDNVTLWGTSVLLVETGPWPGGDADRARVRLNFVALVSALDALASGRVQRADPARYESLPENESRLMHTIVRGATIVTGTPAPPFTGDIGIVASRSVRRVEGRRTLGWTARIEDVGDLRVYGALDSIDASGLTAAPLMDPETREGDTIRLPQPGPANRTIRIGQPGALLLLRPTGDTGTYKVERVIRIE